MLKQPRSHSDILKYSVIYIEKKNVPGILGDSKIMTENIESPKKSM